LVAADTRVLAKIERYGGLDPDTLRTIGGDVMPSLLTVIEGGER
jgi:hypothetical protein